MSADNWTICPRCFQRKQESIANRKAEVDAAYGTVSIEDFDTMRAEFEKYRDEPVPTTWREDYEQGIFGDGSPDFIVRYSGGCTECGLKYEFKHDDRVTFDA